MNVKKSYAVENKLNTHGYNSYSDLENDGYYKLIENSHYGMANYIQSLSVDGYAAEAYFGENNPLSSTILLHVGRLREINKEYNMIVKSGEKMLAEKIIKMFKEEAELMGKDIANALNASSCTVAIMRETNAWSVPMCYDDRLVIKGKTSSGKSNKNTFNEELMISLEDITETKNGYRFRNKDNKMLIIGIGLGLFNVGSTDREITGIILHEIGHAMQHMLVGINANIACNVISGYITDIFNILSENPIVILLFGWWMAIILDGEKSKILAKMKKIGESETGRRMIIKWMGDKSFNRVLMAKGMTDELYAELSNIKKPSFITKSIIKIVMFLFMGIHGILATVLSPIGAILNLIKPSNIVMASNGRFLKRNKRIEQFADAFATWYGYGKDLSTGLPKIAAAKGTISDNTDFRQFNFLYYVPLLGMLLTFNEMVHARTMRLLHGYPTTKERLEGMYTSLQFELRNNKGLTDKQKVEIQTQMDAMKESFDKLNKSLRGPNFIQGLFNIMSNDQIKDLDSKKPSDIMDNVIGPLLIMDEIRENEKKADGSNYNNSELNEMALKRLEEDIDKKIR